MHQLPQLPLGLCQEHYQKMYAHLHKTDSCDSCGGKARKGESYSRHCPAPHIINNYLNHISGESRTLTSSSKLCYTCYKYFSGIVKELQNETIQPQTTKKGNTDSVISYLLQRIQDIEETGEDITKDDVFELALCKTAQKLALAMKPMKQCFYRHYTEYSIQSLSTGYSNLHRWNQSQSKRFQEHGGSWLDLILALVRS